MINVAGSNLAIGISLFMRDTFTAQSYAAAQGMDNLYNRAERLRRQQMTMARNVNAAGTAIGLAATRGMSQWYREGAKFGYTVRYVSNLAGIVDRDYTMLADRATSLGEKTIFTAHQISDGMRWMAQAGMKSQGIYNSIGAIADLATATLTDIGGRGGAADWVTNIAKAFDVPLNESNIIRLSDVIAKSVNKSNTILYEYGEAMKYVQSTAKRLDVTLEETSAGIMVLANAGIQGSMAGTALENFLRYMVKASGSSATKRQLGALSALGLSQRDILDSQGNLLSYSKILQMVGDQAHRLRGNAAVQNAIIDIFGVRGARAASGIIDKLKDYRTFVNELNKQDNYSARVSRDMMRAEEGTILQLISTWTTFKTKFSEAVAPMIDPLLKGLRLLIVGLNKLLGTSTGQKLAMMTTGFILIKTAVMGYRTIVLTLRLAHNMMGSSLAQNSARGVAGYNAMTNAANRYAAASGRASTMGMMGGATLFGGPGSTGTRGKWGKWLSRQGIGTWTGIASTGALYSLHKGRSKFVKKGTPTGWSIGRGKLANAGKWIGKGSLPAILASMGLQMGSEAVGADTGAGKTMGVIGDTLGWAGTGAMIGSIIPGIGTTIGAIVGGVGGLLYSLNDRLKEVDEGISEADSKIQSHFNALDFQRKVKMLKSMGQSEALAYGSTTWMPMLQNYSNSTFELLKYMRGNDRKGDTTLVINVEGQEKFNEKLNWEQMRAIYNIGY